MFRSIEYNAIILREEFIEINDIIEWQQLQIQNGEQKSL
jgi:hypothetical protein